MYVVVHSIDFAADVPAEDRLTLRSALEDWRSLPGVISAAVVDTMPYSLNGGTFMWRVTLADEAAFHQLAASLQWRREIAPLLDPRKGVLIDQAGYEPLWQGHRAPGLQGGIWRMLMLACDEAASAVQRHAMEQDHLLMPGCVPAIRNWSLGRVSQAAGRRRWTHVWEQEYDDLDGLMGPYMNHPIHWGLVDRWYDVECTEWIVDPLAIHSFGEIPASVIAAVQA